MTPTETPSEARRADARTRLREQLLRVQRISWRDMAVALGPVVIAGFIVIVVTAYVFVHLAPPHRLRMAAGAPGSNFRDVAKKYQSILGRNQIKLDLVDSEGSLQNLQLLQSHAVDIALVQSGVNLASNAGSDAPSDDDSSDVVSLGTLFPQPLMVFYRGSKPITRLSELQGQRIVIGGEGTGTRFLALALLKANGIEPGGATRLLDDDGDAARKALLAQQADAIFLSGDSAGLPTLRELLHDESHNIRLFNFVQGEAYVRRFRFLSNMDLPAGAFDLGENLPEQPIIMLAPVVELLAHRDLHPALSDLLIEAAQEIHGKATLLQNPGEYPKPAQHDYPISDDATRYYTTGKGFAYRHLRFWIASLVSRALVVLVPILVVLIPGLRYAPDLYGWRISGRIHKRYGQLMTLERAALQPMSSEERTALLNRLDDIERSIIGLKIPGAYADQIYILRRHLKFVRENLMHASENGDRPIPPELED